MTTLINVKIKNLRPNFSNLKEWTNAPNHVYIGRKGIVFIEGERFPKNDSQWCNPYKIQGEITREKCLEQYKEYLLNLLNDPEIKKQFLQLYGKVLGCWCSPEQCHGNIIIDILNQLNE